jgi:hypothetical protein
MTSAQYGTELFFSSDRPDTAVASLEAATPGGHYASHLPALRLMVIYHLTHLMRCLTVPGRCVGLASHGLAFSVFIGSPGCRGVSVASRTRANLETNALQGIARRWMSRQKSIEVIRLVFSPEPHILPFREASPV